MYLGQQQVIIDCIFGTVLFNAFSNFLDWPDKSADEYLRQVHNHTTTTYSSSCALLSSLLRYTTFFILATTRGRIFLKIYLAIRSTYLY